VSFFSEDKLCQGFPAFLVFCSFYHSLCGWVTVVSPNDISELSLRRQIWHKVASSMRMMRTLRFLETVFIVAKFAKKMPK